MSETTKPKLLGLSSDHRTNRWKITCPACGKEFEPQTTRLATQVLTCPRNKCGRDMLANYNEDTVTLRQLEEPSPPSPETAVPPQPE